MQIFQSWRKTKALRLTVLGIFVHISLFFGTLDIYFSSPVELGLNSFKTDFSLADRVVVFVADGLRYETLQDINFDEYTPFLNNVRRYHGTWGISHTRVPTESRPGHVALFGGMYEDPSAVLSGWKRNPINVDTVFNQSIESWLWGSPDIIPMFNRDNLEKINTYFYDRNFEDFSGRTSTIQLDKWVFQRVTDFLQETPLERLQGGGKIFFLHLLGMDTVGHVFKPNSWEYIQNLKYIDREIHTIYDLFQKFFNDNRTSYVFTSDHGMTDWGSHGSGTDHETQSPFIAWGSGIKGQLQPCDLHQVDTAALISALLGINFPTNSVGVVPDMYLDTTPFKQAVILYMNTRQLGERFNKRHERLKRATVYGFFEPYRELNEEILQRKLGYIEISIKTGSYKTAKEDIVDLIKLIRKGDKYINEYYKYPLLFTLAVGLIFWMIYLILHVIPGRYVPLDNKLLCKCFINYMIVAASLAIALQYHRVQLKYRFYLFFPLVMVIPLLIEFRQVSHLVVFLWKTSKLYLILNVLYCGLGLSLLIFSFYYEFYILIPSVLLIVWIVSARRDYRKEDVACWIVLPLLVCFYPLWSSYAKGFSALQTVTSHFIASYVLWIQIRNTANEGRRGKLHVTPPASHYYILYVYFTLLTISAITAMIYVLYGITGELVQMIVCALSWFILCGALLLATASPHTFTARCLNISVLFLIVYLMMSVSGESLFLVLFTAMQIQWIFLEIHKFNKRKEGKHNRTNRDDFRRCMFFIYFILLSYFGSGNTANMNTFDPMWARQFVLIFNPFLSAIIILLKITIPFLITTISFQTINAYGNVPTIKVFSIIMLYCDLLVMYFMYSIRNDGSWLQIGLSISRFVIVSVMTVVLLLFYGIAKFLTKNTLFDSFMGYVSTNYKNNVVRVKVL